MKKTISFMFLICLPAVLSAAAPKSVNTPFYADTVYLKTGGMVLGRITSETPRIVLLTKDKKEGVYKRHLVKKLSYNKYNQPEPKNRVKFIDERDYPAYTNYVEEKKPVATDGKQNIAVLDLDVRSGILKDEVSTVSDRLRGELINTGKFVVIERGQMEEILKEQGFQQTGACSEASCIVEVGQLLAVHKMVGGSIGMVGRMFSVNLKIIDVGTGKIERQISKDVKCSKEDLLTVHIKNLALEMAGIEVAVEKPKPVYKRWYFWAAIGAAGAGAAVFALTSGDDPAPAKPAGKEEVDVRFNW